MTTAIDNSNCALWHHAGCVHAHGGPMVDLARRCLALEGLEDGFLDVLRSHPPDDPLYRHWWLRGNLLRDHAMGRPTITSALPRRQLIREQARLRREPPGSWVRTIIHQSIARSA